MIVDTISDKNVLPFRVDYLSTMKEKENITDQQVRDIRVYFDRFFDISNLEL